MWLFADSRRCAGCRAGILLLAEEGKLKLDDPLALHLPSAPATWHRITIRHLLTHTSGISDSSDDLYEELRDYTEEEHLEISWKLPLEFAPGSQWSYCNTGYMILGILTSKLTDMHWSEFLKQRILEPAGMTTARVISESDIVKNRADGWPLPQPPIVLRAWPQGPRAAFGAGASGLFLGPAS